MVDLVPLHPKKKKTGKAKSMYCDVQYSASEITNSWCTYNETET
jgi:hypothetical protein